MLTKRLQAIYDLLPETNSVLDVGTDHCLLPISIKKNHPQMKVGASDITIGPLQNAKETMRRFHVSDIQLYQSDGLKQIPDLYECIIIAGMGTQTMIHILEEGKTAVDQAHTLILQANKGVTELRRWLNEHHFKIVNEDMVLEYKYYQILVVEHGHQILNEDDFMFGPILRKKQTEVFRSFWQKEKEKKEKICQKLSKDHPKAIMSQSIADRIEKILKKSHKETL
ncbi:MAG: class I SAM-dependent methyltransferase [Erysipelotrichaceae bacterium]|nr:class I SAM-dependent methyltransferase [Erysipelotrichaceae bacterium]